MASKLARARPSKRWLARLEHGDDGGTLEDWLTSLESPPLQLRALEPAVRLIEASVPARFRDGPSGTDQAIRAALRWSDDPSAARANEAWTAMDRLHRPRVYGPHVSGLGEWAMSIVSEFAAAPRRVLRNQGEVPTLAHTFAAARADTRSPKLSDTKLRALCRKGLLEWARAGGPTVPDTRSAPPEDRRWSRLRHSSGPANDIPAILERFEQEVEAGRKHAVAHFESEAYAKLCHQYSVYSATIASMPDVVRIARGFPLGARTGIVGYVAAVVGPGGAGAKTGAWPGAKPSRSFETDDGRTIARELIEPFRDAVAEVRSWAIPDLLASRAKLGAARLFDQLGAIADLHGRRQLGQALSDLANDSELVLRCRRCRSSFIAVVTAKSIATFREDDDGHPTQKQRHAISSAPTADVRARARREIERGRIARNDAAALIALAELAAKKGDRVAARTIFALATRVPCPACRGRVALYEVDGAE